MNKRQFKEWAMGFDNPMKEVEEILTDIPWHGAVVGLSRKDVREVFEELAVEYILIEENDEERDQQQT